MARHSEELRNSTIKKMITSNNRSITELSKKIRVPEGILHNWRKALRGRHTGGGFKPL